MATKTAQDDMTPDAKRGQNWLEEGSLFTKVIIGQGLLFTGIPLSLGLGSLAFFVTGFMLIIIGDPTGELAVFGWSFDFLFSLLLGLFAASAFFVKGLWKIPIAHVGIPTVFGRREGQNLYFEGWAWHFPGIGGIEVIDAGKNTKDIDIHSDDIVDKEGMPLDVEPSVTYMVDCEGGARQVNSYIEYGEEDAEANMRNELRDELRKHCAQHTYEKMREDTKQITSTLRDDLQNEMDRAKTGLKIVSVQLKKFRPPDAFQEAATKREKEKIEAESDVTDADTRARQIERLTRTGLSPDVAAATVQAGRGEGTVNTHNFAGLAPFASALAEGVVSAINTARNPASAPARPKRRRRNRHTQSQQSA